MYEAVRNDRQFSWPNGARMAVVLSSEYEPVYEFKPLPGGFYNYRHAAEMRYEATCGMWRILRILERHGVPSTFFVNGATAERYPESVRAIVAQGHEIAAHSWNSSDHFSLSRDAEDDVIGRSVDALTKAGGVRPTGWLTPRAQISDYTVELLIEHGFTWHSDCFDDDLPYFLNVGGTPLVEVPRTTLTDDYAMMGNRVQEPHGDPRAMLALWMAEFYVLYGESPREPRLLAINWHHTLLGRPAMSRTLDRLIEHIKRHEDVWFARGGDVAGFWLEKFGKDPMWQLRNGAPRTVASG